MTTKEQIGAALSVLFVLADAVKEAGTIPSGHLYAIVMGQVDFITYQAAIRTLKGAEVIREENQCLIWNVKP